MGGRLLDEKSSRRLEDLDGALLVGHLLAQRLDLRQLLAGWRLAQPTVGLGLADPAAQRLRRGDAELAGYLGDLAAPLRTSSTARRRNSSGYFFGVAMTGSSFPGQNHGIGTHETGGTYGLVATAEP